MARPRPPREKLPADRAFRDSLGCACRDPWYAHLAPSSWSSRGRAALNFDEWQGYDSAKRNAEIAAIVAVVQGGSMPLKDYTFFNGAAKLNEAQRQRIVQWASAEAQPAH